MKNLILIFTSMFLLVGCMSDKEYQLRRRQLKNQAAHEQTYEVFTAEGPVEIKILKDGKVAFRAATQEFKVIDIPDGMQTQKEITQFVTGVAAGTYLGNKAIKGKTNKTTINNAAE